MHFGSTQAVNDAAFEVFREHQQEIESEMEYDLEWVQDENRRRLIRHVVDVGYEDREKWEEAHQELARSMAQLEEAMGPYLDSAREAADRRAEEEEAETS